jgi:phosphoribosylglycinamide formyltransferase-1
MHHIVLFASGKGSNAAAIINYFRGNPEVNIALIVSNNREAGVLQLAEANGIPHLVINRKAFYETQEYLDAIRNCHPSLIVLAGFMWMVPRYLVEAYPGKIVNIHPALLPKYGGKGMYGMHVHEAVIMNEETETGITIHYVNEHYDEGEVIEQQRCAVLPDDNAQMVADKVHAIEHFWYPRVIERVLTAGI